MNLGLNCVMNLMTQALHGNGPQIVVIVSEIFFLNRDFVFAFALTEQIMFFSSYYSKRAT